jgi:cobalamin biosynthesis protein CobT
MKYLETSLEKLARILSRQYNVEVVFEGQGASTNGKTIYLPNFQEVTEELEKDLNGYLDHEVSHVKFTQFEEVHKVISAYHKDMLNGAEDVRIERLMMKEYPGTENHLVPLRDKLNKKLEKDWFSRPWPIRFIIALMRVMEGDNKFPADKEIQPHLDACKEEIEALNKAKNTKDVRVITEQIIRKLLKDRAEEKEEQKNGEGKKSEKQKGQKSKSQSSSASGGSESSGDQESDSSEGEEQDEKSQDQKQGQSGEKSDDKKNEEKKDGKGQVEGEKEENKDFKPSDSKTSKSKEKGDSFLTEKSEKAMEQFEIDVHRMINSQIEKQIEKEKAEMKKTGRYEYEYTKGGKLLSVPYSSRFDEVIDHTGKDRGNEYPRLRTQVKPLANKMKTTLERIFKSVENSKWKSEREQGLINARSLSQLKSNPNYRTVFKQLSKFETDKVAVSIVVDLSGSMSGDKIHTAKQTAAAMSEALNGLGIKFEVVGFTTGYRMPSVPSSADLTRYNRSSETLEHHVFKGFDTNSLCGLANIDAHRNNHDGESVLWAAKRLAARPEKRKILMVMSDGMPAGAVRSQEVLQSDLRMKLAQIEKFGIETIGFGILTDCVKHFYKDFVVVSNLRDLTTTCLTKLSKLLTANLPLR